MIYNQKQINENLPFLKILKEFTNYTVDSLSKVPNPLLIKYLYEHNEIPVGTVISSQICDSKNFIISEEFYNDFWDTALPFKVIKQNFKLCFDKIFINFPNGISIKMKDATKKIYGVFLRKTISNKNSFLALAISFNPFEVAPFFIDLNSEDEFNMDSALTKNFFINCVLFLNQRNVIKKEIETKQHYTMKDERGQYRKIPINYYLCDVEINQEVVEYVKKLSLNSKKRQYCFRFDVRGHWRHLQSEKYKLKRGQNVWVDPYVKGNGIYIPKTYLFEQANKSISNEVCLK